MTAVDAAKRVKRPVTEIEGRKDRKGNVVTRLYLQICNGVKQVDAERVLRRMACRHRAGRELVLPVEWHNMEENLTLACPRPSWPASPPTKRPASKHPITTSPSAILSASWRRRE